MLDLEQSRQYKEELKQAEEDMVLAYTEKTKLEGQEAELISLRALKSSKGVLGVRKKKG